MKIHLVYTTSISGWCSLKLERLRAMAGMAKCAFIRSPAGFSIVVYKSLSVDSQRHAQLIILREALVRVKEFEVNKINCRDPKTIWRKLFDPAWKFFPVFSDIISLSSSLQVVFTQEWHPLVKEVKKLARKAASTQISCSWP